MGDWLTIEEATRRSGYTASYLRDLARAGKIKSRKIVIVWLLSKTSLDAYLREQDKRGERRGRKPSHLT